MTEQTNIAQLDHDNNGHAGGSLPAAQRGLEDLRGEAESLGVKVDMRWGEPRLQEEIDRALAGPELSTPSAPGADAGVSEEAPREKSLHELNMEQWASNRDNFNMNEMAGEAAKHAVMETLAETRPDGKRTRKNLRPAG